MVVALLVMSVLGFLQGSTPCDASLGSADEKLSGYELAEENDYLHLWLNRDSAEVAVLDKKSGYIWFSNPPARAEEERIAKGALKEATGSQISLTCYTPRDQRLSLESYNDSVRYGQFEITAIKGGVRVDYTVGQVERSRLPAHHDQSRRVSQLILSSVDESGGASS